MLVSGATLSRFDVDCRTQLARGIRFPCFLFPIPVLPIPYSLLPAPLPFHDDVLGRHAQLLERGRHRFHEPGRPAHQTPGAPVGQSGPQQSGIDAAESRRLIGRAVIARNRWVQHQAAVACQCREFVGEGEIVRRALRCKSPQSVYHNSYWVG